MSVCKHGNPENHCAFCEQDDEVVWLRERIDSLEAQLKLKDVETRLGEGTSGHLNLTSGTKPERHTITDFEFIAHIRCRCMITEEWGPGIEIKAKFSDDEFPQRLLMLGVEGLKALAFEAYKLDASVSQNTRSEKKDD